MEIDILVIGIGEYVIGFVGGVVVNFDKSVGVVVLVFFDFCSCGKVN